MEICCTENYTLFSKVKEEWVVYAAVQVRVVPYDSDIIIVVVVTLV